MLDGRVGIGWADHGALSSQVVCSRSPSTAIFLPPYIALGHQPGRKKKKKKEKKGTFFLNKFYITHVDPIVYATVARIKETRPEILCGIRQC